MTTGDSPLLAGPIGECCTKSVKHSGEAKGKAIDIDGIPTYLSAPETSQEPAGKKRVLLFCSDVFSPFSLNNQLIQDYFASKGLSCVYFMLNEVKLR